METTLHEQLTTLVSANKTPLRSTTPRAVIIAELVNRIEKLETALRVLATEVEGQQQRSDRATPSLLDHPSPAGSAKIETGAQRHRRRRAAKR